MVVMLLSPIICDMHSLIIISGIIEDKLDFFNYIAEKYFTVASYLVFSSIIRLTFFCLLFLLF